MEQHFQFIAIDLKTNPFYVNRNKTTNLRWRNWAQEGMDKWNGIFWKVRTTLRVKIKNSEIWPRKIAVHSIPHVALFVDILWLVTSRNPSTIVWRDQPKNACVGGYSRHWISGIIFFVEWKATFAFSWPPTVVTFIFLYVNICANFHLF